jgi:hypothetical protein
MKIELNTKYFIQVNFVHVHINTTLLLAPMT